MLNLKNYIDHDKLIENISIIKESIKDLDWKELASELKSKDKEITENASWFFFSYLTDHMYLESSNSDPIIVTGDGFVQGSELLSIDILRLNHSRFERLKRIVQEFRGINYAGFMFLGPNSYTSKHTDDNVYSLVITVDIEEDNINSVYLDVDEKYYYFNRQEVFVFDSRVTHSARNSSASDWTIFILRVDEDFFKFD
jgi:hypothetical protein